MAKANERTEREFQLDVNTAVANTEGEIFEDALGDDPLEDDGDTSLEEMGEGLEGDDLEEEDEAEEEGEAEASEEDAEQPPLAAQAEEEEEQPRDQQGRFDTQQQDRRGVPSGRLREEAQARRQAEQEATELRRQLAEMNGRVTELSTRVNATPKPATSETPAKPDMFADPEGYERWVIAEAEKKADAKIQERFGAYEQQQQQQREANLNANLERTATGERGFEFQAAYRALTSLDPKDANARATVQRILSSPDQGQAILDWFEENGAEDFRESVARQLGLAPVPRQQQRGNGQRQQPRQQSPQPRNEVRLPPSLNNARGGGRQQTNDPEMLDDSDSSVFRFATR
jgi:hypothetical protein